MTDQTTETPEEIQTIDDAIASAMEEQAPAEEVIEETVETGEDNEASAEGEEEEIQPAEAEEVTESATDEEPAEASESDTEEEIAAPQHWANEDKETYKKIKDPEARKLVEQINDRFRDAHQRKMNEIKQEYEPVLQELAPYRNEMQKHNMNETQFMQRLVQERTQFERLFQTDPRQVISDLARNSGTEVYFGDGTAASEYQMSPEKQENLQLRQQLESSQRQTSGNAQQQVLNWANEQDESGNYLRPHFEKVGANMMTLMQAAQSQGRELTLDDAYTQAVRLDDELYQQEVEARLQQKQVASQAEQDKARNAVMEKARKGSKRLSGRAPAKQVRKVKSIDDALNLALEEQRSSA